jgi:hypothetical protein
MSKTTLYELPGGYDVISAVAKDLLPRVQADSQPVRFWRRRGEDGVPRDLLHSPLNEANKGDRQEQGTTST